MLKKLKTYLKKEHRFLPIFKITLIILVIVVIGLTVYLLGYYCSQKEYAETDYNLAYKQGWDDAKKVIEDSGLLPPEPEAMPTIEGRITQIKGNSIYLKVKQAVINPLSAPAPEERIVNVNNETKLIKQVAETKNKQELAGTNLPQTFQEVEVSLKDLEIGDRISATAGENIKMAGEFTAKEIRVIAELD